MKRKTIAIALVLAMGFCILSALLHPVLMASAAGRIDDARMTIAAGGVSSLSIQSDGSLWSWGYNGMGQLGDGSATNRRSPVKVLDNAAAVSAGMFHTMAIKNDHSLWAWGYNVYGQLGDGAMKNRSVPVRVLDNVEAVSSRWHHTAAIKTDSSLWVWGHNNSGQIGDGSSDNQFEPKKIMENVATVAAGGRHTLAVKTDGSLWAWGYNIYGQLGDATTTYRLSPVRIMDNVAVVSAGDMHTLAIKTDGTLWAWGSNVDGQIGDGSTTSRSQPVKILDNTVSVSAGSSFSMAIRTDGSLWAWGDGRLGDGTSTRRLSPRKIMDGVAAVSIGDLHTVAIKTDGSLWSWGGNSDGQLGDGTTAGKSSPVKIMSSVRLPEIYIPKPPPPAAATPDAPLSSTIANNHSSWATIELEAAAELSLIPDSLEPSHINYKLPITRAEFAGIVVRVYEVLTGATVQSGSGNPFMDTNDPDTLKAYSAGLMVGISSTQFSPNSLLAREQAATALTRSYKRAAIPGWSYETDASHKLDFTVPKLFGDDADISDWARESVYFMAANGIINGIGNNNFAPRAITSEEQMSGYASATREEALIMALRMVNKLGNR